MIRLAIIGTGGMANGHADNFSKMKGVRLTACCDIVEGKAREFAAKWKIPAVYGDFRKMLARETLDAVSVVTTDAAHAAASIAAAKRGLHVMCEKPLATSVAEARRMLAAVRKAGVINMVNFSYRNSCGLQAAAKVVAAGGIGRVIHVESSYLQSWLVSRVWGDWRKNPALLWRLSSRHGSLGTLGDIGCHILDMTAFLGGEIDRIACQLKTFDKGVRGNRLGEYVFDANDSFAATLGFAGGGLGAIHSSRWACGHLNSLRARVYGDKGGIEVDLDRDGSGYRICTGREAVEKGLWKEVKCPPTPNNYQRFIRAIRTGRPDPSDFANGLKVQTYLASCVASDRLGKPVRVGAP
ncbi:MAG: Gfo/Idh/MocA family oxidoreductase [Planctomycetota bacterium]|nr:Gfo/Idh/MocA family oxidoreductase [Planctomycetota bacterium]